MRGPRGAGAGGGRKGAGGGHRNLSGDNYYKKMFRIGKRDLAIQIFAGEQRGAVPSRAAS